MPPCEEGRKPQVGQRGVRIVFVDGEKGVAVDK